MQDDFFTEEELRSLRNITLEELRELSARIGPLAAALAEKPAGQKARKEITNIFHTIGGSAALAGFERISNIGADTETLLKRAPQNKPLPKDALEKISSAHARLSKFIKSESAKLNNK